jgi:hypothetical protein
MMKYGENYALDALGVSHDTHGSGSTSDFDECTLDQVGRS